MFNFEKIYSNMKNLLSQIVKIGILLMSSILYFAPSVIIIYGGISLFRKCSSSDKVPERYIEYMNITENIQKSFKNAEYSECERLCKDLMTKIETDTLMEYNPIKFIPHLYLGRIYFSQEKYEQAKPHLQKAIDSFILNEEIFVEYNEDKFYENLFLPLSLLTIVEQKQQNWATLDSYYSKLKDILSKVDTKEYKQILPHFTLQYGHMSAQFQNYNKAEELYLEVINGDSRFNRFDEYASIKSEAYYSLISTYVAQLKLNEAQQMYEEMLKERDITHIDNIAQRNSANTLIALSYIYSNDYQRGLEIVKDAKKLELTQYGLNSVEYVVANAAESMVMCLAYLLSDDVSLLNSIEKSYQDSEKFWTNKYIKKYKEEYFFYINAYKELLKIKNNYEELELLVSKYLQYLVKDDNYYIDAYLIYIDCLIEQSKAREALELANNIANEISIDPRLITQKIELSLLQAKIYLQLGEIDKSDKMNNLAYKYFIDYNLGDMRSSDPMQFARILKSVYYNSRSYGDYKRALDVSEKIIEIYSKANIKKAQPYVLKLLALRELGDADNILQFGQEILSIASTEQDIYITNCIIGYAHMLREEYAEAEKYFMSAYSLIQNVPSNLRNWGLKDITMLYALSNNREKAEIYASQMINNREAMLLIAWQSKDVKKIEACIDKYYDNYINELNNIIPSLSYNQLNTFVHNRLDLDVIPSIAVQYPNSKKCVQNAYNAILATKNLSLRTTLNIASFIRDLGDDAISTRYNDILRKNKELQVATDSLVYERIKTDIDIAEQELYSLLKTKGAYDSILSYEWNDVRGMLQDDDIAVEFVKCNYIKKESYIALLLRKDWSEPILVELLDNKYFHSLASLNPDTKKWRKDDNTKRKLINEYYQAGYNLIWSKLEPYINEGDNVYFSPMGLLHQMNIEVFQDANGKRANEKWNLHRVSSTRELCMEKPEIDMTSAVLYGNLLYDVDSTTMVAESRTYRQEDNYVASRGFVQDSTMRDGWNRLVATNTEINSIAMTMQACGIEPTIYKLETGNEESFKALSGKKTPIIHLATHGFFYKDEEAKTKTFFETLDMNKNNYALDNSLKRSGLILAGAQKAWLGEPIPDNVEDGVLLAEEIATMDLTGTDLVVLSACETGLGEITSEGVFGLQRAFKKAGVQTLIMSLWKVDDNATSLFMRTFYKQWLGGKSKHAAFLDAQAAVRECKESDYSNPYYWASFIMLD